MILYGFNHYYRFIPTDGRPPEPLPNVKLWMGHSRGSWKGNTLVVDVTNIKGGNWLDQVGNFFSDNAHVVERFTLADANTIDYEVTVDDAKVFTRPWTIRLPLGVPARPAATSTRMRPGRTPVTRGIRRRNTIASSGSSGSGASLLRGDPRGGRLTA